MSHKPGFLDRLFKPAAEIRQMENTYWEDVERRYGTSWLEKVQDHDLVHDVWGDATGVNAYEWDEWRRRQGR